MSNSVVRSSLIALFAAAAAVSGTAHAQDTFPSKPLRLVIAFGPGGVADTTSRLVAEQLGNKLGQRVVVENTPGAGGIAAARAVLNAPADGHSLALLTNGNSIAVSLFKSLPYNIHTDFAPVSKLGQFDFYFTVRSDGPYKSLNDLVGSAKANPGKLNVGSVNPGSTQHLTALLLKTTANIDYQWVPFKTSPDLTVSLLRGDIDMAVDAYSAMKGNVDDGKLKLLATASAKRSPALPDVPPAREVGGGDIDVVSWNALFVKAGTSPAIIEQLNKAVREVLPNPELQKKLKDMGITGEASSPEELTTFLKADIAKWAAVIEKNKIEKQ